MGWQLGRDPSILRRPWLQARVVGNFAINRVANQHGER
jgi:hypothetical protein